MAASGYPSMDLPPVAFNPNDVHKTGWGLSVEIFFRSKPFSWSIWVSGQKWHYRSSVSCLQATQPGEVSPCAFFVAATQLALELCTLSWDSAPHSCGHYFVALLFLKFQKQQE